MRSSAPSLHCHPPIRLPGRGQDEWNEPSKSSAVGGSHCNIRVHCPPGASITQPILRWSDCKCVIVLRLRPSMSSPALCVRPAPAYRGPDWCNHLCAATGRARQSNHCAVLSEACRILIRLTGAVKLLQICGVWTCTLRGRLRCTRHSIHHHRSESEFQASATSDGPTTSAAVL